MATKRVTQKNIDDFILKHCYKKAVKVNREKLYYKTLSGYTFDRATAKWMIQKKFTEIESIYKENGPICLGFNPEENSWTGWSHRAYATFKIGDTVKKGDGIYTYKGVVKECKTIADCKTNAKLFAKYIG